MTQEIFSRAKELHSEIVATRRHLHQHPELSFQEYETSKFIQNRLKNLGIEYKVLANTGVVAHVGKGSRCVALRADIDALPIEEETNLSFASKNHGVMHACGHDSHTAMLLGAAKMLKEREENLSGIVKLIFQPGEEKVPGGASIMIAEGALNDPEPEIIFGQHVNPDATVGEFSFVSGPMMASADELYWTLRGKGGHAAQPHKGNDIVVAAAELILHLQTLVSRLKNPLDPGVLSVTSIHGGSATNIIPELIEMKGTLRAYDSKWRHEALREIESHSKIIAGMYGAECEFNPQLGYPPLINNSAAVTFARDVAEKTFGKELATDFEPKMWGEDFAYYAQKIPAAFWMLGVRQKNLESLPGLHNPKFTPDEEAFSYGAAMMASVATEYLNSKK